jgi:hypothetical protein
VTEHKLEANCDCGASCWLFREESPDDVTVECTCATSTSIIPRDAMWSRRAGVSPGEMRVRCGAPLADPLAQLHPLASKQQPREDANRQQTRHDNHQPPLEAERWPA